MKSKKIPLRHQWYVDSSVQKSLLKRMVIYCLASLLFVSMPIAFFKTLNQTDRNIVGHFMDVISTHWPILLMLACMIPFAVYDTLRLSNRFAGPVFRLRRELRHFRETGSMNEVFFRDNDFWHDLSLGVNELTLRIRELENQLKLEEASLR